MPMGDGNARLACFELWGGNSNADHAVELPGLEGWVYSAPFERTSGGGDVHYFSVCGRGVVSRIAVADVSGHGHRAGEVAQSLRVILQRHSDNWDQSKLMQELNDAVVRESVKSQYATAAVLGFYSETGELLSSNAGHPPALWYRAQNQSWVLLKDCAATASDAEGLPLGVMAGTRYCQTSVRMGEDDVLVIYTDGITEATNEQGEELGHQGLLDLARSLGVSAPREVSRGLIAGVNAFRNCSARRDDETLVVLQRTGQLVHT
jgi:phosphoserine phosphatase RsbU/P